MAKNKQKDNGGGGSSAMAESSDTSDANGLPDAFQLFEPSAKLILNNIKEFAWLLGAPFILSILSAFQRTTVSSGSSSSAHLNGTLLSLSFIAVVVAILVAPGVIVLQLQLARNKQMSAGDAFSAGLKFIWRMIGLGLVLGISLVIAFCLLIVPFFILLPRVVLSPYFLIDQDLGVFDAIRASNETYKKYHGIWGILGVSLLLNLPSAIPFIGNIISTCLGFLYQPAFVLRYIQLQLLDAGKRPRTPFETKLKP